MSVLDRQTWIQCATGATDEDRELGLDLAWDLRADYAERLRDWARKLDIGRPRHIYAYQTRGGDLVVQVRIERGHKTTTVGIFRALPKDEDFEMLWRARKVEIAPGVPPSLGARVMRWAARRWKGAEVHVERLPSGRLELWMPSTKKRPELKEIIDVDEDLDAFYKRWRAANALRSLPG